MEKIGSVEKNSVALQDVHTVVKPEADFHARLERTALAPLTKTGKGYYFLVASLLAIIAWGVFAYSTQFRQGLIVTGMRDHIQWGLYMTLFVFFIGISHAGTLISAILRTTKAGWRTPVTRMAEFITVVALMTGGLFPMIDLGRPDRIPNLFLFGRYQSPVLWDILAITTYLTGSLIYLYLPLIPDLALCRDRLASSISPWRRWFYAIFSLGWRNTMIQKRQLESGIRTLMVLIIPVAVSVHTVVSWIFGMTLREPWNNPMFGAYFVAGAIFSGLGSIIILMLILRKAMHLEEYITPKHFLNLGYLLGVFAAVMAYFNLSEYITAGYKMAGSSVFHFQQLFVGSLAPFYWFYAIGGILIPGLIILLPWTRNIKGITVASILVVAGMWVERYFIVVSGLRIPLMPYDPGSYAPTWVEWSVMAAAFAGFSLVITIFIKLFPVIATWEVAAHHDEESLKAPLPEHETNIGSLSQEAKT